MKDIIKMAKALNNNLPKDSLRRNVPDYELVTYMNHVISFLVCEMYDEAALFIMRASRYLGKPRISNDTYYLESRKLIDYVMKYLTTGDLVTKEWLEYVKEKSKLE